MAPSRVVGLGWFWKVNKSIKVHEQHVVSNCGTNTLQAEPVGFEAVAEQSSQAEVSRLFSAMLQLINNGNIQILPGQSQQPFQLKLLSTNLLHRKFLDGPAVTDMPSQVRHKTWKEENLHTYNTRRHNRSLV